MRPIKVKDIVDETYKTYGKRSLSLDISGSLQIGEDIKGNRVIYFRPLKRIFSYFAYSKQDLKNIIKEIEKAEKEYLE